MSKDNIVYIGRKPVMNYVLAVLTLLNKGESNEIAIRARGRAISIAVDTAEVTKNRYIPDLRYSISIGTEKIPVVEGGIRNVSTMEILLKSDKVIEKHPSARDDISPEEVQKQEKTVEKELAQVEPRKRLNPYHRGKFLKKRDY